MTSFFAIEKMKRLEVFGKNNIKPISKVTFVILASKMASNHLRWVFIPHN